MSQEKEYSGNITGFSIPSVAIIRHIQNLLRDSYKEGFPIIKEIIQNANDGGARRLDIGISKGLKDVSHPLLQNPSLFFVNDGNFTNEDAQAISWLGMDINAQNSAKIGKFGLGQKSIFHFCEAFFYIASSESITEKIYYQFVNPYAEFNYDLGKFIDQQRPKWGGFTQKDKDIIENYLLNSLPLEKQYFILWIPLRMQEADQRNILSKYYNDCSIQKSLPEDMDSKIAMILPMLQSLQEIYYWCPNDTGYLEQKFHVFLKEDAKRCSYPKAKEEWQDNHKRIKRSLIGQISLAPDSDIIYGGVESIVEAEKFYSLLRSQPDSKIPNFWNALGNSTYWLKIPVEDRGKQVYVPDKAIPHCAVIFSRKKAQTIGSLTVQWAVFLPLGDGEEDAEFESVSCEGDWDYTLLLHGYLFLDSGRRNIKKLQDIYEGKIFQNLPGNGDEMIEQWNNILANSGTLSYLLAALEEFCREHQINQEQIKSICTSILRTKIFKSNNCHKYLYGDYYWVYRLHPEKCSWQLIEKTQKFLALPTIPEGIWTVFPKLHEYANDYCLILESSPNLLLQDDFLRWEEEQIIAILTTSNNAENIFSQSRYVEFMANLLKQLPNSLSKELQKSLKNILNQAFIQLDTHKLESSKEILCQLIGLFDEYSWFEIDCNDTNILINLQKQSLDILIVPMDFAPERGRLPLLNGNDANLIIRSILNTNSPEGNLENSQELIKQIINGIKAEEIANFIKYTQNLKFIPGFDCRNNKNSYYSPSDIIEIKKQKLLFRNSLESREVVKDLQTALKDITIVLVNYEFFSKLFTKELEYCTNSTCFTLLQNQPELSDVNNRKELFKRLLHR